MGRHDISVRRYEEARSLTGDHTRLRRSSTALRQIGTIRGRSAAGRPLIFIGVLLHLRAHAHDGRLDALDKIFKAHRQGGGMKTNRRIVPGVQFSPGRAVRSGQPGRCASSKNSDRKNGGSENGAAHPASGVLFGHEPSPIAKSRPTRPPSAK